MIASGCRVIHATATARIPPTDRWHASTGALRHCRPFHREWRFDLVSWARTTQVAMSFGTGFRTEGEIGCATIGIDRGGDIPMNMRTTAKPLRPVKRMII